MFDPDYDDKPWYHDSPTDKLECELCGRVCDREDMEYIGDGDNRVRVCPECADEAAICEECGEVTRDYVTVEEDELNSYPLCPECALAHQAGGECLQTA